MKQYTAILEKEADGGYSVWVPDLPGCASQGETYEEALANIREAIALYIESLRLEGLPAPEARTRAEGVPVEAA